MKYRLVFVLLLAFVGHLYADEDVLAPATFFRTKLVLPSPWKTGEVIAREL